MRKRSFNAALAVILLCNWAWADGLVGGWAIEKRRDPITYEPWVIMQTLKSDKKGAWLQIRCESKRPLIVLGVPDANFPINSQVQIVLKIDRSSPTRLMFVGIGEAGALATSLSNRIYSELANSKIITFQATGGNEKWAATFSPTETPRAMKAVLVACPVSSGGEGIPSPFDPKAQPVQ
jgi:hypothetical protein